MVKNPKTASESRNFITLAKAIKNWMSGNKVMYRCIGAVKYSGIPQKWTPLRNNIISWVLFDEGCPLSGVPL